MDRTIRPLVIALGVFGGVALLAALLIAIQLISRQLGDAAGDLDGPPGLRGRSDRPAG